MSSDYMESKAWRYFLENNSQRIENKKNLTEKFKTEIKIHTYPQSIPVLFSRFDLVKTELGQQQILAKVEYCQNNFKFCMQVCLRVLNTFLCFLFLLVFLRFRDIRNAKNKRFLPAACLMSDKQKKAFVCQNNVTI